MAFPFLDRTVERARLDRALHGSRPIFAVVYGRRRCGKSRLLREIQAEPDVYYLADTREMPLQVRALAEEIGRKIDGFADVEYPSLEALLRALSHRMPSGGFNLFIDEFPYLVQHEPSLPGTMQKLVDEGPGYGILLCGSSQRMMRSLVLDHAAPLFGRAAQIVKIEPLRVGWIVDAFDIEGEDAVKAYSVFGGIPRYWELAVDCGSLPSVVRELVLDRTGVLHDEPQRLLIDDMRSAAQPHSLLSLIANGCHRLSELAGRLGKPAGNLTRPLDTLIELGYIRRELPFGESLRSTKRTLYRLDDPFLQFWYRFVLPNRSLLELDRLDQVAQSVFAVLDSHVASVWEQVCRISTAFEAIDGVAWKPGQRWWGTTRDGRRCEVDVVAESLDGKHILLGEVKWENRSNIAEVAERLEQLAAQLPFVDGRTVHLACWVRRVSGGDTNRGLAIRTPEQVVQAMR